MGRGVLAAPNKVPSGAGSLYAALMTTEVRFDDIDALAGHVSEEFGEFGVAVGQSVPPVRVATDTLECEHTSVERLDAVGGERRRRDDEGEKKSCDELETGHEETLNCFERASA